MMMSKPPSSIYQTQAKPPQIIAFQGAFGANSDNAARLVFPNATTLPCRSFDEIFSAVREGRADRGLLPIENSTAGRVSEPHLLLPNGGLHIVGEYFHRVRHQLLSLPGTDFSTIKQVFSHPQALMQCRNYLQSHGLEPVTWSDTADAAAEIARRRDPSLAAIAPELAAEIYGLSIAAANIEDTDHNTTRFLVLSLAADTPDPLEKNCVTSLVFRVRNMPAALYKALGGFATNGVNLTKIESYLQDGKFIAAQFYVEAEGHPEQRHMNSALEELKFYTREIKILGTFIRNIE